MTIEIENETNHKRNIHFVHPRYVNTVGVNPQTRTLIFPDSALNTQH
jgi:hypothetical protein